VSGAKLLKRVLEIDMKHCQNRRGELKIVAAILEQPVIEKIHTHWVPADGLHARLPKWCARTVSSLALRLNRPWCHPPMSALCDGAANGVPVCGSDSRLRGAEIRPASDS
jgi:hypothetical protein